MKKILSLTLVAVMLLSTMLLTSCNIADLLGSFGSQDLTTTPAETTPAETTPEETTPAEPPRYTITQEEWVAAINSSNFTFTGIVGNEEDGQEIVYVVTEDSAEIKLDGTLAMYYIQLNNKFYTISKLDETTGWVAVETEMGRWITVCDVIGVDENVFVEYLKYNEASKSYVYEEDGNKAEFYFENGKLIKGTITNTELSSSITIENAGTTTVTLPEYTVYQPKTTVTKEEFIAGFNPENFTFSFLVETSDPSGEVLDVNMCSVLVDSYTQSYEYRVDGVATQYGIIVDESTYSIFKNEETGIWECLKESDPVDWDTELTVQGLWYLDDVGGLFDGLTYREETESYFFEEDGYSIEIWYKDNQLERIELYVGDELRMCVENVGTTVVSIPDYVMAEN